MPHSSSNLSHPAIRPYLGPGLFITATGTDVGKTVVTAALAAALHRLHIRVGVCKPITTGCHPHPLHRPPNPTIPLTDDDYSAADASLAASAAGLDPAPSLLPFLSPIRFAAPVSPHLASKIEQRPIDWERVTAAFDYWQENSSLLLVEGAGGWYVPLERPATGGLDSDFMIADLAAALRLPILVVTNANLGSINSTLLTIHAIRQRNLAVAGLVINRVPPAGKRDLAVESNLEEIPRLAGVPLRAILPDVGPISTQIPSTLIDALTPFAREWQATLARES